jgi:hypothetical protein
MNPRILTIYLTEQLKSGNEIDLSNVKLTKASNVNMINKVIVKNDNIKTIKLDKCSITESILSQIKDAIISCKSLESLSISKNDISSNGTKVINEILTKCQNLRSINLSNNLLCSTGTDELLKGLQENKTLEELNLSNNSIKNYGLLKLDKYLSKHPKISKIDLSNNDINSKIWDPIKNLLLNNKNIKSLDISGNIFSEKNALELLYFEKVKKIEAQVNHDLKSKVTAFEIFFTKQKLGDIKDYCQAALKITYGNDENDSDLLHKLVLPDYYEIEGRKFPLEFFLDHNKGIGQSISRISESGGNIFLAASELE